jgi:hypothetical protein
VIEPFGVATVIFGPSGFLGSFGAISTSTWPDAMPNSDDPMAFFWNTTASLRKNFTSESSKNSRIWRGDRPFRISISWRRNSSHSTTVRWPGRPASLASRIGSSAGFRLALPSMNSTTSWPWFMQCLISG